MARLPDGFKLACLRAKYRLWNRKALRFHRELVGNQFLSRDELDEINWRKRRGLLAHAHANVPFYRDRFREAGMHPEDIRRPEDYEKVPLLTRDDLRLGFDRLISDHVDKKRLRISTTGGTTGEPVKVCFDPDVPLEALAWRTTSWWDVHPGLDSAFCMRLEPSSPLRELLNQAIWFPTRRIRMDASRLGAEELDEFVRRFNRLRPKWLHGYVGALDHIASHVLERQLEVVAPRAVSATSSPMSAVQRHRIEQAFRAPVYDQYGSCEVYWVSAQCRQKQYLHVSCDARHVEFVDDLGHPVPAERPGRIAVTDLENRAFPLIRYLNGDRGKSVEGSCSCGVNLPLMDKVRGRESDFLILPDGSRVSGDYLTTLFDHCPDAVRGFSLRQKTDLSIVLTYVPNPDFRGWKETVVAVRRDLESKTGNLVPIVLEETDRILHDKGKLRFITRDAEA